MKTLKACHISDTHDVNQDLNTLVPQDIDILFITGDMTYRGTKRELTELLSQLSLLKQRIKHIVCVVGNHEVGCERDEQTWRDEFANIGATLLFHESVVIEGIKIFGSPYTPEFYNWAYMYSKQDAKDTWSTVPKDTQVLLTHGPPHLILDACPGGNVGCPWLRSTVLNDLPQLKYHMFGHIHESYGQLYQNDIFFSNGSIMTGKYRFLNKPYVFQLEIK